MNTSSRTARGLAAAFAAALALTAAAPALAAPGSGSIVLSAPLLAAEEEYPTWAEVEAARNSEQNAEATYTRLQDALQRAQNEAASASEAAAAAATAAAQAERDLSAAAQREATVGAQLSLAEESLDENSEALGRTVAWLYRDGTGLARYSELASSQSAEQFMSKLSVATQVTGTWNTLTERAAAAVNNSNSLQQQAESARQTREALATEAKSAAAAAEAARTEAEAAVALALERSDTLYEQLAVLRDTTAETERLYQIGRQVEEQNQAQPPAAPGGGGDSPPTGGGSGYIMSPAEAQAYAASAIGGYGWGGDQFSCLVQLWNGESGWRVTAENPWSGAYGIPQSWPAEKMAVAGADWRTNGATQINWGLAYISAAYGNPCNAWYRWNSRNPHWY